MKRQHKMNNEKNTNEKSFLNIMITIPVNRSSKPCKKKRNPG